MQYVVYTDLDGTLLDHHTYSYEAAQPALDSLRQQNIPVIPVTSKTRREIEPLRESLGLVSPFIVENGSAVFIPEQLSELVFDKNETRYIDGYWVKELSPDVMYWSSVIEEIGLSVTNAFKAFSEMTVDEVMELTGLEREQASKAKQREYSDPIFWFGHDSQFNQLRELCSHLQVDVVRGGRFVHLLKGADKGRALSWLHGVYQDSYDKTIQSIALGDGENDLPMLKNADYPVQIKSPTHDFPELSHSNLYRTSNFGPSGWTESIHHIIQSI